MSEDRISRNELLAKLATRAINDASEDGYLVKIFEEGNDFTTQVKLKETDPDHDNYVCVVITNGIRHKYYYYNLDKCG